MSVPSDKQACLCQTRVISPLFYHVQSTITNRLILSVYRNLHNRNGPTFHDDTTALHIAVQSFIYQDDLAYQPTRRAASCGCQRWRACDIPDKGHARVADGRIQPAQTKSPAQPPDRPIGRVPSHFGEPAADQVYLVSSNFCDCHFRLARRVNVRGTPTGPTGKSCGFKG